jgi:hypothetical protein
MSFSADTKNELARIIARKKCCRLAELAAIIKMDGLIQIGGNRKMSLHLLTESAAVARKVITYLKELFSVHTDILMRKKTKLKKNNIYTVVLASRPEVSEVLRCVGMTGKEGRLIEHIIPELIKRDCCRRAYLRGVFLGGGSVSDPEGDYHLEILVNDEVFSSDLCKLLEQYDLKARINKRKNWDVVYLKGSEEIVKQLTLIKLSMLRLSRWRILSLSKR